MSNVTNVIILALEDEPLKTLEEINRFIDTDDTVSRESKFTHINEFVHGPKALECDVYVGAFNYLNLENLLSHVQSIKWSFPESVQVCFKREQDDRFSVAQLTRDAFDYEVEP